MNNDNGGQLNGTEKQRQTITQLAGQKLDAVYRSQSQNYRSPSDDSMQPKAKADDWRKYHSAWQEYYQKYYGNYYGKAAQEYIQRERKRFLEEQESKKRQAQAAIEAATLARRESIKISSSKASEHSMKVGEKANEMAQIQSDIRDKIRNKAVKRAKKMSKSRHFLPIVVGCFVLLFCILLQYNQQIIGKIISYMSPGSMRVNTIEAIDGTVSVAVHENSTLMVPKINIEAPIVFGSGTSVSEMDEAMRDGVAHFSISGANAKPGEKGNFVLSGHSSGNAYYASSWKWVFTGLNRMEVGDMIYVDHDGVRYAYRVFNTELIDPSNVAALQGIAANNPDKPLITLLTCAPVGSDKYRLLVEAEQISPDYDNAATSSPVDVRDLEDSEVVMPKNDDPPFTKLWKWLTGQS